MSDEVAVHLAIELQRLGVSQHGIVELLSSYSHEEISRQLAWLPLRKAKRPEAFIIEAVRHSYSAPNQPHYAPHQTHASSNARRVDKSSQRFNRLTSSESERHRTPNHPRAPAADGGMAERGTNGDTVLYDVTLEDWSGT